MKEEHKRIVTGAVILLFVLTSLTALLTDYGDNGDTWQHMEIYIGTVGDEGMLDLALDTEGDTLFVNYGCMMLGVCEVYDIFAYSMFTLEDSDTPQICFDFYLDTDLMEKHVRNLYLYLPENYEIPEFTDFFHEVSAIIEGGQQ